VLPLELERELGLELVQVQEQLLEQRQERPELRHQGQPQQSKGSTP